MRAAQNPVVKDLVLVGGGHSHVTVLKRFGMEPMPGVRLTVICRDVHTPYSGMLPGLIAGHYTFDEAHIDLGPLAHFAGARLYHDEVTRLDLSAKLVLAKHRPPVPYDVLSINVGSTPSLVGVVGAAEFAVPVKPINNFVERWELLRERVRAATRALKIGIVGAGAGGVELALSVQVALKRMLEELKRGGQSPELHLFSASSDLLPTLSTSTRARFRRVLEARGIAFHAGRAVVEVRPGSVICEGGFELPLDEVLWVTNAGAPGWLAESGLAVDAKGFVTVHDTLESTSQEGVFAAGDVASVLAHPREKAGVFAVRQGRPLEQNLRRALLGQARKPFSPQKNFLSIISTGDAYAVASRGSWSAEGRWVWKWKDWIDRRFMRKYNELPEMARAERPEVPEGLADESALKELSAIAMRCGGCGAKVGSTILSRVLARLRPKSRNDVLIGLDAPDDAAVVSVPADLALVQTVDFFRAIVDDPYVFGKIAANHSLGDIFAMGGAPRTALAIATIPYGLESKVEDTLEQMLKGAIEVLDAAETSLVGGHTSEGAELALGFAIHGVVDPEKVLRKGGMRPGERLILTKPIGTGTLFAADMRGKAKGRWIVSALETMLQTNRAAADCLRRHGASACTDVTGFGLLGHLLEMAKASSVDVALDLEAVPTLDGALETVALGIFSSLQPQNLRLRRAIQDAEAAAGHPLYALLFDPQTAGGLLSSVPADRADACLSELRSLGCTRAAIIGEMELRSERLEPIRLRGGSSGLMALQNRAHRSKS